MANVWKIGSRWSPNGAWESRIISIFRRSEVVFLGYENAERFYHEVKNGDYFAIADGYCIPAVAKAVSEPIPLNELTRHIHKFDFIYNTIPSLILNRNILSNVNTEAAIIDIASNPGGTDFEACKHFGITARLCLSLPGKYSPKASALIISKCIVSMLN